MNLALFQKHSYTVESIQDAYNIVLELQQDGKFKKQELEHAQSDLDKTSTLIEELKKKKVTVDKQVANLKQSSDDQSKFHCDKIDGDCPYIELIKGTSLKTITSQLESLEREQKDLISRIDQATGEQKKLQERIAELTKQVQELAGLLQELGWKEISQLKDEERRLYELLQQLEKQLSVYETQSQQMQSHKERLLVVESELRSIQTQLTSLQSETSALASKQQTYNQQVGKMDIQEVNKVYKAFASFTESYQQIRQLAGEWSENQLLIKQLKEQETKIKNLYQVFSKELLFFVVKDFLPQLQDLINTLLHHLVDYTVRFELPESMDEKMELTIEIHDEKGVRSVKSLSGGQLVVLKLVRILAVGRLLRVQCMFLDETINNLDSESIGRVASLLEDYVTGNEIKMYVVTHSPQIQSLPIREKEIHL